MIVVPEWLTTIVETLSWYALCYFVGDLAGSIHNWNQRRKDGSK